MHLQFISTVETHIFFTSAFKDSINIKSLSNVQVITQRIRKFILVVLEHFTKIGRNLRTRVNCKFFQDIYRVFILQRLFVVKGNQL